MARKAYLYLLLTTLFWGGNAVAGKLAVGHVSPMLLVFIRWTISVLALSALGSRQVARDWPVIRRHLPMLAALGACGFALFNVLFYTALNYTTAINVSIEQAGMPVLIIVANFALFGLRVSWAQMLGVLLTIMGVALTASNGDLLQLLALRLNFGDALMLVAVVLYSGYTIGLRFKPNVHWTSLMMVLAGAALAASIPFAVWEVAAGRAIYPDGRGWLLALYIALFPSVIAQMLYIRGNELIGANRAGLFINLVPIFGTLLSVLLLGETFHFFHGVALICVFGGIWLAESSGRKQA